MSLFTDKEMLNHFDTWPWATGGFLYIFGAVIYSYNWPECFSNGKFDIFGNSHNIFHICVVLGALIHWYGSIRLFHERQMYMCPA